MGTRAFPKGPRVGFLTSRGSFLGGLGTLLMLFGAGAVPARPHLSEKNRDSDAPHDTPSGLSFQRLAEKKCAPSPHPAAKIRGSDAPDETADVVDAEGPSREAC